MVEGAPSRDGELIEPTGREDSRVGAAGIGGNRRRLFCQLGSATPELRGTAVLCRSPITARFLTELFTVPFAGRGGVKLPAETELPTAAGGMNAGWN